MVYHQSVALNLKSQEKEGVGGCVCVFRRMKINKCSQSISRVNYN